MEMTSDRHLPLERDTVWEALNDPAVLQACVPGCESMERLEADVYQTAVTTRVGPVKARFRGHIRITDAQPPERYTLSFEGQGGAGFAKGAADVALEADGEGGCHIRYVARARVGGKLAQVGSRLLDGTARKLSDEFFDNFTRHLGGDPAATAEPAEGAAAGDAEAQTAGAPGKAAGGEASAGRGWKFWKRGES